MSEVNTRPSAPRGRGSSRGTGRGGLSNRGGRGGSRQANGTQPEAPVPDSLDDDGDIGTLKSKYSGKIGPIKEMFPDWTEQDIAFALEDTNGDLEMTVERISEGTISQWADSKKKKDRSQSKAKEAGATSSEATASGTRGGRGRGALEGARGGRGRGAERGRGASRGPRAGVAPTNGPRSTKPEANPVAEPSWDTPATGAWDSSTAETTDGTPLEASWENVAASEVPPEATAEAARPSLRPDGKRSWATLFAPSKPAPAPYKAPRAIPNHDTPVENPVLATADTVDTGLQDLAPPLAVQGLPPPVETTEIPATPPISDLGSSTVAEITPSADELTETNLEQLPDTSGPIASATAASTVASTAVGTPNFSSNTSGTQRPPMGGFQTSAWKATTQPGRTPSFQRKVLEQQEAVVMPGKHAVDRAAVQFGSMGLNGSQDDVDVDSDREDAETRTQPPQHSPVAPRAALPPAPQQQGYQAQPQESLPTPRQAPGLPPVNHASTAQLQDQPLSGEHGLPSQPGNSGYPYNQFNDRYGTQAAQHNSSAPTHKPYEPFGQQAQHAGPADSYPSSSQPQQPTQGAFSSAANDVSSLYTSDNQRNAYQNNYYGNYGQQQGQDSTGSQQRTGSAFGTSAPQQVSQYATSGQQHSQGRFGQAGADAQTSGNSTPNPSVSGQQGPSQPHGMMPHQQGHGQAGGQQGGYPGYGYPYSAGYYSNYVNHMNQYGYGGSQGGYGGGPFGGAGGKQGMYNQGHQGYGMSPQSSYDQHSASPANVGAFGSQVPASGRDSAAPGSLGTYGRTGSAQPSDSTQQYSGAPGASHGSDVFGGRSTSGYQGHNQGLGATMGHGSNDDSLRAYNDPSKVAGGPSPATGQPGGRPGSAANQAGQGQAGSYGAYPSHMNQPMHGQQGSQYGSAPGGHQTGGQNHQAGGYGGYGAGYGGNYYGNNNQRGGWGANYGH